MTPVASADTQAVARKAHWWRLGRASGGYSPTTNGAGENSGWSFWLWRSPRWEVSLHHISKTQAEWNALPPSTCPGCGDWDAHDALGRCPADV
jgi:hypothetical protein